MYVCMHIHIYVNAYTKGDIFNQEALELTSYPLLYPHLILDIAQGTKPQSHLSAGGKRVFLG